MVAIALEHHRGAPGSRRHGPLPSRPPFLRCGDGRNAMKLKCRAGVAALVSFIVTSGTCGAQVSDRDLAKIETVVVIYAENRSFDHLYGHFPGANGIDQATDEQKTQLDHDGTPLRQLTVFNAG